MNRVACVAVVKDEECDISEWIAFQFAVGFDAVIIFDNGSTDSTSEKISAFASTHDVRLLWWTENSPAYQLLAYEHAIAKFGSEFRWLAFFDCDEFLVLPDPSGIRSTLDRRSDCAAVGVSWAIFGSSGHATRPDGLVIESFQRRAPIEFAPNRHIKSIIQADRFVECLNAHQFEVDGAYHGLGGEVLTFSSPGILDTPPNYASGKLHHYFTRSYAHWEQKMRRGYHDAKRTGAEFGLYDRNDVVDCSAEIYVQKIRGILGLVEPKFATGNEKLLSRGRLLGARAVAASGVRGSKKMKEYRFKYAIVACARWESEFIVEWLNYYRAIGYEHVYLYCNDDNPFELYEKVLPYTVGSQPFVTFKFWDDQGAQFDMYVDFIYNKKDEAEYVSFFDIDEFLRISRFNSIGCFVDDLRDRVGGDFDSIYFNWCTFGNSGYENRPHLSVLRTYKRREKSFSNFMTKHITRTDAIDPNKIRRGPMTDFWHYWNGVENFADFRIINPLGKDVHDYYDDIEKTTKEIQTEEYFHAMKESAMICHYRFKSRQDFLVRVRRGVRGVFGQQADLEKAYHDGRADQILAQLNEVEDNYLSEFWRDYIEAECRAYLGDGVSNDSRTFIGSEVAPVSKGKVAVQSSVSEWSRRPSVEEDAAGALNGIIDGRPKFHTGLDDEPWWRVDLAEPFGVSEVRIYNRMEQPGLAERASRLAIDIGFDPQHLTEIYRRETDEPFGGVDGSPLIFRPSIPVPGRYVRIRLLTRNYLHLDQVEVYGEPLPEVLRAAFVGSVDA